MQLTMGRYIVRYNEPNNITTLGGMAIPHDVLCFIHPYFLAQLESRGLIRTPGVPTYGDVRRWMEEHTTNILNSNYSDWLVENSQLIGFEIESGVVTYRNDSLYDAKPIELSVDGVHRGSSEYLLISPPEPEEEERDQRVHFHGPVFSASSDYYILSASMPEGMQGDSHWYRKMNYRFSPEDMEFLTCPNEKTYLYFGMELEMSTRLSPKELQLINTTVEPKREHWFFFKDDSSVSGAYVNRMEMVTVPMSPKRMRQEWKIFFKKLHDLVEESEYSTFSELFDMSNNLTNGIHIHLSKTAFVQYNHRDHRHKYRFIAALNQWDNSIQEWLQKVSKRPTPLKDNNYCRIHPGLDGRTLARRLSQGPISQDRHAACHEGPQTVEVRIFQGIPDLEHILCCTDFTEALFEYSQHAPHSAYGRDFHKRFTDFVFSCHGYKNAKEVLAQCV